MRNVLGSNFYEKFFEIFEQFLKFFERIFLKIQYHPFPLYSNPQKFKSRLQKLGTVPNYVFFAFNVIFRSQ